VTLASQIPEETCRRINLSYRDPKTIRIADFANREDRRSLARPQSRRNAVSTEELNREIRETSNPKKPQETSGETTNSRE
jgi:hypothetical protein